jgi:predicted DNA-binding transcriptional regulator YafY
MHRSCLTGSWAAIAFNHDRKQIGPQYELPGLWFSAEEIHALLTMQHLLSNLDTGGLLGPQIKPLLARLTGMLGAADNPIEEVQKRIQIQTVGARQFHLDHFQAVGSALLRRKRLIIRYHARGSDQTTEREISPQRLVHYRDNWYLDAWCHLRDGLRAFAVDAIQHAEISIAALTTWTKHCSTPCSAPVTAFFPATTSHGRPCVLPPSVPAGWPPNAGIQISKAKCSTMARINCRFPIAMIAN